MRSTEENSRRIGGTRAACEREKVEREAERTAEWGCCVLRSHGRPLLCARGVALNVHDQRVASCVSRCHSQVGCCTGVRGQE
jgi:hypothetical protein